MYIPNFIEIGQTLWTDVWTRRSRPKKHRASWKYVGVMLKHWSMSRRHDIIDMTTRSRRLQISRMRRKRN